MSNEKKVVVVFLKSWRGYSKDELAGFDSGQAESLIDGGVAELAAGGKKSGKPSASGSSRNTGKPGAGKPADAPPAGGSGVDDQPGNADTDATQTDAADDEPKP